MLRAAGRKARAAVCRIEAGNVQGRLKAGTQAEGIGAPTVALEPWRQGGGHLPAVLLDAAPDCFPGGIQGDQLEKPGTQFNAENRPLLEIHRWRHAVGSGHVPPLISAARGLHPKTFRRRGKETTVGSGGQWSPAMGAMRHPVMAVRVPTFAAPAAPRAAQSSHCAGFGRTACGNCGWCRRRPPCS